MAVKLCQKDPGGNGTPVVECSPWHHRHDKNTSKIPDIWKLLVASGSTGNFLRSLTIPAGLLTLLLPKCLSLWCPTQDIGNISTHIFSVAEYTKQICRMETNPSVFNKIKKFKNTLVEDCTWCNTVSSIHIYILHIIFQIYNLAQTISHVKLRSHSARENLARLYFKCKSNDVCCLAGNRFFPYFWRLLSIAQTLRQGRGIKKHSILKKQETFLITGIFSNIQGVLRFK